MLADHNNMGTRLCDASQMCSYGETNETHSHGLLRISCLNTEPKELMLKEEGKRLAMGDSDCSDQYFTADNIAREPQEQLDSTRP